MLAESLKGLPNHRCPNRQCYAKTSRTSTQHPFAISQWGPGRTKTQIHMTRVLSLIHLDYLSSTQISSDTGGIPHMFPFPQICLGSLIRSYDFGFCSLQQSCFLFRLKTPPGRWRLETCLKLCIPEFVTPLLDLNCVKSEKQTTAVHSCISQPGMRLSLFGVKFRWRQ